MMGERMRAARRLLQRLGVTPRQATVLVLLGVLYAGCEGIGVAMLWPVLKYVEQGPASLETTSRAVAAAEAVRAMSGLPMLLILVALAFLPVLARQLFRYAHQTYGEHLRWHAVARQRTDGFAAFMNADMRFFVGEGHGRLVSVLTTELERTAAVLPVFLQLCEAVILLAVYLVVLTMLASWLVPVALVAIVAVTLLVRVRIRQSRTYGALISAGYEAVHVTVQEKLAGIRLIKLRGQEAREAAAFRATGAEVADLHVRICRAREAIEVSVEPTMILGALLALYVAVTHFGMTLAGLGIFMFALLRSVPLLKQVNVARQTIESLAAGVSHVDDVITRATAARDALGGSRPFTGVREELVFDGIGFAYEDTGAGEGWALRGVSFRAERGSITAIVGRSGAGKSTLLDLIPRFRDFNAGDIRIDGESIRAFDVRSLRSAIGMVDQHGFLFDDTIAANIAYGLPGASRDAVERAARQAHAHHFIEALPHGYQTVVGDRGVRLSVGQRQRVSLARALLQDPDVLLLDEPTSALDSESEQQIQLVLDRLRATKIIIVVAHRLSTIRGADRILVLDEGRIVQRGDHQSLLQEWGTYKKLFDLQIQV